MHFGWGIRSHLYDADLMAVKMSKTNSPSEKKFSPGDFLNMPHHSTNRVGLFAWLFSESIRSWQSQL